MPPSTTPLLEAIRDALRAGGPDAVLAIAPRLAGGGLPDVRDESLDLEVRRVRFPPGCDTGVHDHGTWGLDLVLAGALRVTDFEVRSWPTEEEADLAVLRRRVLPPGAWFASRPGSVHRVENPGPAPAATVHVGGLRGHGRRFTRAGVTWRTGR